MMHRRKVLALNACFLWEGRRIAIRTNSVAVLRAAASADSDMRIAPSDRVDMQWEIVAEIPDIVPRSRLNCRVVRDRGTVYLDMGPSQWFAFDSETGNGAGFVYGAESDEETAENAVQYLSLILNHLKPILLEEEQGTWQR
uniref:Uncharacterized protein n=2 Tax=Paracidobacterium acidisoli TaxID=2303751 RepID=A0A372ILF3_9BACT